MRVLNIGQLYCLVAFVYEGSYAKAAAKLGRTPQAVSKSIHLLSEVLGQPLFIRKGRGIKPTDLAYDLAERAVPILDSIQELDSYMTRLSDEGRRSKSECR